MSARVDRYIKDVMPDLVGWLFPEDALAIVGMNRVQRSLGVVGDILELGAYQGKTLALLALLSGEGEQVIGIDGFTLGRSSIEATRKALHAATGNRMAATLIKMDLSRDRLPDLRAGSMRMMHVDAGHLYREVTNDLINFEPFMTAGGVIVADDYFQRDDPGVCAAVHDFCIQFGWSIFASSRNKVYLCQNARLRQYVMAVLNDDELSVSARVDLIRGRPIVVIASLKPMLRETIESMLQGF
jgi:hypothetical protein